MVKNLFFVLMTNLYSEAEILGFEKKNGHYQTKIRHQNEEKILDHGALILATGGKEVTPKGYLYGAKQGPAGRVRLVRYADDMVLLARSQSEAQEAWTALQSQFTRLLLAVNQDKSQVTTAEAGFART